MTRRTAAFTAFALATGILSMGMPATAQTGAAQPDTLSGPGQAAVADATLAENLLGKPVRSSEGDGIGRVDDVLLDRRTGSVEAVIVATGGFLGLGERMVRVPWNPSELGAAGEAVELPMTAEEVAALPPFDGPGLDEDLVGLRGR